MENTHEADLLAIADELHSRAEVILQESKLLSILTPLGDIQFVGSYLLNVMYRPDIDICVIAKSLDRKTFVDTATKLLECDYFQTVAAADTYNFEVAGVPKGYFYELIALIEGKEWKLDIWYLNSPLYSGDPAQSFKLLLQQHPEAREKILQIKHDLFDGTKYKFDIKGVDIYKAVLEEGISSTAEFLTIHNK